MICTYRNNLFFPRYETKLKNKKLKHSFRPCSFYEYPLAEVLFSCEGLKNLSLVNCYFL